MTHPLPPRFILWRREWNAAAGKWNKAPCDHLGANIDPHDPSQWRSYEDADRYATFDEARPAAPFGVGFVLNGDGWFCIDIDNCGPEWTAEATAIYQSFTGELGEVSTSGKGLHIFGRCDPSQLADRRNKWGGDKEFYFTKRFVALSQHGIDVIGGGLDTSKDWTEQLRRLVPEREHLGELPDGVAEEYTGPEDDAALLRLAMASKSSTNAFGQGVSFADLWEARAEPLARQYPAFSGAVRQFDHSSADAALMSHLAFWTGRDMPRMDRLFRMSALVRDKYRDRADYRRDTVQNAARMCNAVYNKPTAGVVVKEVHKRSEFYCAAGLIEKPVPKREWLVQDLVPSRTVTMLGGDGGTGKSLLALQLACAVATDGAWLGRNVVVGGALFISAEDDEAELHRRLTDVVTASGATFDDLNRLTLRSLAGEDALLATLDRSGGVLNTTPLFSEIDKRIADERPALVVLDTLADLFPGNENDRAQARHFIGRLRGIANRHSCAVILLAHPSLSGMTIGAGTSGSTAWNNSVRSRLYLDRVADNPDARLLSTKKANYGRNDEEICMTWRAGIFVADSLAGPDSKVVDEAKAERVFLRLLDNFTKEGRTVKSAQAHGYAPRAFAVSGRAENVSKQAFHSAMERLFAKREIVEELGGHRSPSKQTKRIVRANTVRGAEPMLIPLPNPMHNPLHNLG